MKKFRLTVVLALLLLVASLAAPQLATAAPSMTPIPVLKPVTPYQPIAEQLGQQLQSLVNTPATPGEDQADEANQEPPPTFGTRALNVVINIAGILRDQSQQFITDFSALPQLSDWISQQSGDPRLAARWSGIGNDLYSSAGMAFVIAFLLELALYPVRRNLRKRVPRNFTARLALVLTLFFLRAVPILAFVASSVVLMDQHDVQKLSRFLIMNLVYALALMGTVISCLRGVLLPKADALRFVPATRSQAVYGFRWLCAFSVLIIFGYFFIEVTRAVHVPDNAVTAFINVLALVLVVMGIIVIVQKRAFVALLLRGNLSAAQQDLSWFESLRLWFARQWHRLAIAYLVIGYAIAATGVRDALVVMLRGTSLTLLALVAARLLLGEIAGWEMRSRHHATTIYSLIKGLILRIIVVGAAVGGIMFAWGVDLTAIAASPLGHRLLGSAFSIGLTLFILGLIYEFFSATVDRHLTPRERDGRMIEVNARSRTLLPMIRNTIFVLFGGIVAMVTLSEAGINIAPLLAGAGVLGVAVGFGSQTLVKDFLTGLFIVLENTIAVGDVIKVGDQSGVVEAMSMRTLRLRDTDGSLHILPFSEVSKIVNLTKEFAHAVIKVNVATDTDIARAFDALRAVGAALQKDPNYQYAVLGDTEMIGVDSINDSSISLIARIKTEPGKQWDVKRAFLMMLLQRFAQDGIKLPSTTTVRIEKPEKEEG